MEHNLESFVEKTTRHHTLYCTVFYKTFCHLSSRDFPEDDIGAPLVEFINVAERPLEEIPIAAQGIWIWLCNIDEEYVNRAYQMLSSPESLQNFSWNLLPFEDRLK